MAHTGELSASQIRAIFPRNLRKLIETERSIKHVADEIGIPRQQLGRYVSGATHPSLENLKKICSYFKVDARILFEEMDQFPSLLNASGEADFCKVFDLPKRYVDPSNIRIVEGIYRMWKISFSDKNLANVSLVSVKRKGDYVRVSGIDPVPFRPAMLGESIQSTSERRFHGVAMQVQNSCVIITRMSTKSSITCKTLQPDSGYLLPSGSFSGLCSATLPGPSPTYDDIVPIVYEAVSPTTKAVLSAARHCGAIPVSDLPDSIISIFKSSLRPYFDQ